MATANDVLALVSSGTGAMEASVANFFSPGDRVIVCTAGKFGERWVEIAKSVRSQRPRCSKNPTAAQSARSVSSTH